VPGELACLVRATCGAGSAVVAVSPHLDDGILSCGALLAHLARRCDVTVVTVFTEAAPPPWSLPTRRRLRALGMDAETLYARRRAEDTAVLGEIGAVAVHLGLRDAPYRRSGEATAGSSSRWRWPTHPTYPTVRFDALRGRIARADAGLPSEIGARVSEVVQATGARMILVPLGIGRHVDHLVTRGAAEHLGEHLGSRIVYYSDFPYSETAVPDRGFVRRAALEPYPWLTGRPENAKRIAGYSTQFANLFPHGVPTSPEIYWIPAADSGVDCERGGPVA
jgi:LmbE family N-acetylglucosaminyl deacetylase